MTEPADPLLLLRLSGARTADTAYDRLVGEGFAVARGGRVVLTPAGRAAADARFRFADGTPEHTRVAASYERFSALNGAVIKACSDWQRESDWKVVDRLAALDDKAGSMLLTLGRHARRYERYRPLLRTARTRVEDGDAAWFVSPSIDSYHTVWMQLHEDLLIGLGLDRSG